MKANIYRYSTYKLFIKDRLAEPAYTSDAPRSISQLAKFCGVQRTYVSRILNRNGNFSEDQLFLAAKYLDLSAEEMEFLQVLGSIARCKIAERRESLVVKLEEIRATRNCDDTNRINDESNIT